MAHHMYFNEVYKNEWQMNFKINKVSAAFENRTIASKTCCKTL